MTYYVFSGTLNPTHFTSLPSFVDDDRRRRRCLVVWNAHRVYVCGTRHRQLAGARRDRHRRRISAFPLRTTQTPLNIGADPIGGPDTHKNWLRGILWFEF